MSMAAPHNEPAHNANVFKQPGAGPFWIAWTVGLTAAIVALLASGGRLLGWVSLVLIILSHAPLAYQGLRRAAQNLGQKISAGRLEGVISNLEDAVIVYDHSFRILIFNSAAEKIFGVPRQKILDQTIGPDKVNSPELMFLTQTLFPSLAPAVINRSRPNSFPQIADVSFTSPEKELRVFTDRIVGEDGTPLGFVKVIRDRTREVQFIKSKSDFVSLAAHQLRTPLTAINWTFESLMGNQQLGEADRSLIQNGLSATKNLLKTVNDLLETTEIEEGKFGYRYEEVDLVKFIGEILANAQIVAQKYGLSVYFDKGGLNELKLRVDSNKMGVAVSNLIDNAMKYNSKNGSVTVSLKPVKDQPYVQVAIRDTGIGIPPGDVERLFRKFFRAPNAQKIQADGSGLGLYITKNIIQQHGGNIWAESTLGRGTTFFFTLPIDPSLIPKAERPLT